MRALIYTEFERQDGIIETDCDLFRKRDDNENVPEGEKTWLL